jgi:hypothetical protein
MGMVSRFRVGSATNAVAVQQQRVAAFAAGMGKGR